MKFSEKLLKLRKEKKLSQKDVAEKVGIALRTYVGYEKDGRYPRKQETYFKLADLFECDPKYLMDENAEFVVESAEQYGSRGKRQAEELLEQFSGLFAGGELSEEDKDGVMAAMRRIYLDCKEDNKKYTPKKYREPVKAKVVRVKRK